ncbi:sugar ABC transporter permease [Acholeplasma equirhinis]|uniref:carbohydrate ABC transporter permease n=1 Tax=Acholeplasma equirhinis TaxID=555393 RepID=UPI00197AA9CB|nr:sugar ABC transporter permease [Acholeplasma equirhinis]MBN3490106.1 sugar ABC transporter permease [Acholeplasma equirhinis]
MNKIKNKKLKNLLLALPFVLPGLLLVSIFVLYPMFFTIYISLSEYKIVSREINFIGFANYIAIFSSGSEFWYAVRNNFLYAIVTIPVIIFGGLFFAYLLDNLKHGKTFFKVGFYLPVITSWVIVALVFRYMFGNANTGFFNYLLVDVLHLTDEYIPWLFREWSGNAAIWLMGIWKNLGWALIIFLAALQTISKELYEAASVDGASFWQKFKFIVMASIKPTIFFVMVNMVIGSFNVFLQVLMLTGGNPNDTTTVLQFLLYSLAFSDREFGQASALGLVIAVLVLIVTIILNKYFKLNKDNEGNDAV